MVVRRSYTFSCLRLALFLTIITLESRAQTYRIDHIGVTDGLTQGSVYFMHKDSRGFLWLGTQDGLNRYDGQHFRTFRPKTERIRGSSVVNSGAIRGVNIFGIVESSDGNLWIGTEEGLNRYDRGRDRFDCFQEKGVDGLPRKSRTLPFFVDQHELLYLSDNEGLVSFNWRTLQKKVLNPALRPPKEYDLQSSTIRTTAGDVWLHAPKGLIRYNLYDKKTYAYFSDRPDNQVGDAQPIFSFLIDRDNTVWLGSANGLIRLDYRQCHHQRYRLYSSRPMSSVFSIAEDHTGGIWMGTQSDGLLLFDKRTCLFRQFTQFTNNSRRLTEYEINKVFVDDQNIVWANVDPDGLAKVLPNAFLFGGLTKRARTDFMPASQRLTNYTVRGFLEETPRRIWIANEGGIDVFDPMTYRVVDHFLTNSQRSALPMHTLVKSLFKDSQGQIWIGTTQGVLRYRPQQKSFESFSFSSDSGSLVATNYIRNLCSFDSLTLLGATEDGLYLLDLSKKMWQKAPVLAGTNVFSLYIEPATRQLWVGTYLNGFRIYQLPPVGQQGPWRLIRTGLTGFTVLNIADDPDRKTVWIATDRGLGRYNRTTKRIKLYTEAHGLANSFIYGVLADANRNLWMSTNRGISRFDPASATFTNFGLTDGLQDYEFNGNAFLRASDGKLYFGGVNGFNYFRPTQYRSSLFNPKVHIYDLRVNEEPFKMERYVDETDEIDLTYKEDTFSLEFAALDFYSAGHNTYQYQLAGYDDWWVQAGQKNYVRYANIPPGDYTFLVKAANKDKHWSNYVRRLRIHVHPPFWLTVPFIIVMIMVIGAVVYSIIRSRMNNLRRLQAERLQLAYDIQEQVKKEIARDLHDEIGTRLATLKLYTSQMVQHLQGEGSSDVTGIKSNMFGLINDTISDIRNLLRKLDPRTLEQYGYVAAVEELFGRINAVEAVQAHLTLNHAPEQLSGRPALMLYRITQELLNNSLKHASPDQITLLIQGRENGLSLEYWDNGAGFDYERCQRGLGIGNIESRVAMLHGKISWDTQPGRGTHVFIEVPLRDMPTTSTNQHSMTGPSFSG